MRWYPKAFTQLIGMHDCYGEAFRRVMRSGMFLNGTETKSFEEEWAAYLNVDPGTIILTSSGTTAIELVLRNLMFLSGDPNRDQVIVQSFAPSAVGCAILNAGLYPYFVDVDHRYQMDLDQVEEILDRQSSRILAIIIIHTFGMEAPIERLRLIREAYDNRIFLIEDCSHAHGLKIGQSMAGTFADYSVWSFYPTKNLPAIGDAGAVYASAYAREIRAMGQYGWVDGERSSRHLGGSNCRCDELQAAFLREGLKYLDSWNNIRRGLAAAYMGQLERDLFRFPAYGVNCVFHQFPVRVDTPYIDGFFAALVISSVARRIYLPLHQQPLFKAYAAMDMTSTEWLYKYTAFLPMHPGIIESQGDIIEELNTYG